VAETPVLKGWTAIASYLRLPVSTVHRWVRDGMLVQKEGRFVVADRAALEEWIGRESHMKKPAHVQTGDSDIFAVLKESLTVVRDKK